MKKVTILLSHLGYGGISNSAVTLCNSLVDKYDVEILSVYRLYNEPVYDLDEKVTVNYISNDKPNKMAMKHYLKQKNYKMFFKGIVPRIKSAYIRRDITARALKKVDSDVIISTSTLYNNLVSRFVNDNVKKIAWEHAHHNDSIKYVNKLLKSVKNMDYLVCVSEELTDYYKEYLGDKVIFIPNSLDNIPNKLSKLNSKNIVSVGKLIKEKGFDDLLRLFKKVSNKYPDWKLNIVGDGLEKNNLLQLSDELKLKDKVIFHGYQDKIFINDIMYDSSIFVMTSLTESFGLSLIEAMSYGVPCVSYSSAQGANEIINNDVNGFIIEDRDEDEMIKKIELLINDEKLRNRLGKNARKTAKKYSKEINMNTWKKLINKRRQ